MDSKWLRKQIVSTSTAIALYCYATAASAENAPPRFELLHLWRVGIEAHALKALSDPVRDRQVSWQEQLVDGNFNAVRSEYEERLALGNPPSGVFWIGGLSSTDLVKDGIFRLIRTDSDSQVESFSTRLLPEVFQTISFENGISALPLGIHIQNHAIYNTAILNELNLPSPSSWQEFLEMANQVKAAGYYPLSMSDESWQLRFLVLSIFAENLTASEFLNLLTDPGSSENWKSALQETFLTLDTLRSYVNPDNHDLAWEETVMHVVEDRALLNVLGDFVTPLLGAETTSAENNLTLAEQKVRCDLAPGNRFVMWSFDTIALTQTQDERQLAGQDALVEIATDHKYIGQYIARKGGLPVYLDAPEELLNACSKDGIVKWNATSQRINLSSTAWNKQLNIIENEARRFWLDPYMTADQSAEAIVSALAKL